MNPRSDDRLRQQPTRICAGPSMSPTVMAGERVYLRASGAQRIRRGEAVLFSGPSGDYDVLHRFLFRVPFTSYFVHRGDAADSAVGLAQRDRIVGVALLPERRVSLRENLAGVVLVAKRAARHVSRRRSRRRLPSV